MEHLSSKPAHVNFWLNRAAQFRQLELMYCAFVLLDVLSRDGSCLTETSIARWGRDRDENKFLRRRKLTVHFSMAAAGRTRQSHRSKGRKTR
jgi:hypothetical protein